MNELMELRKKILEMKDISNDAGFNFAIGIVIGLIDSKIKELLNESS